MLCVRLSRKPFCRLRRPSEVSDDNIRWGFCCELSRTQVHGKAAGSGLAAIRLARNVQKRSALRCSGLAERYIRISILESPFGDL